MNWNNELTMRLGMYNVCARNSRLFSSSTKRTRQRWLLLNRWCRQLRISLGKPKRWSRAASVEHLPTHLLSSSVCSNDSPRVTLSLQGPSHPLFLARPNAPAAILSSIKRAYTVLSDPFPFKPLIVFSAQKPFYSQPNYSSWWLGIFWCLFRAI